MVSATVKAYPVPNVTVYLFSINTTTDSTTFWDVNTYFHTQVPHLSDAGLMGYYYCFPDIGAAATDPSMGAVIYGLFFLLNQSSTAAASIMQPLQDYLTTTEFGDKVVMGGYGLDFPDFYSAYQLISPEAVGIDGRLGSRLIGSDALTRNSSALKAALQTASPSPNFLIGHMVAGKGVRDVIPAGGSDAVNPAWRTAYAHIGKDPPVRQRKTAPPNPTDASARSPGRVVGPRRHSAGSGAAGEPARRARGRAADAGPGLGRVRERGRSGRAGLAARLLGGSLPGAV